MAIKISGNTTFSFTGLLPVKIFPTDFATFNTVGLVGNFNLVDFATVRLFRLLSSKFFGYSRESFTNSFITDSAVSRKLKNFKPTVSINKRIQKKYSWIK